MSTTALTLAGGTVGEAMSAGVILCSPETSLRSVARMLSGYGIHCVVVVGPEDDAPARRIRGIVSDLDLIEATAAGEVDELTAAALARTPVPTLCPGDQLDGAARLMAAAGRAHVVVLDPDGGHPVGVLSTLDVARALAAGAHSRTR
jgi:CBS domain-containing protein